MPSTSPILQKAIRNFSHILCKHLGSLRSLHKKNKNLRQHFTIGIAVCIKGKKINTLHPRLNFWFTTKVIPSAKTTGLQILSLVQNHCGFVDFLMTFKPNNNSIAPSCMVLRIEAVKERKPRVCSQSHSSKSFFVFREMPLQTFLSCSSKRSSSKASAWW